MIGGGGGTRGAEGGGVDWGGQRVCFWQFFTFLLLPRLIHIMDPLHGFWQ